MNILHLDCSTRKSSHSRRLSAAIVSRIAEDAGMLTVTRRDLGKEPIPHALSGYADSIATPAAAAADNSYAHRLSNELIDEVEAADIVVIGTPMHNFTVPSVLKAWIDQVLRVGRTIIPTPKGKVGAVGGRPVFVAIASGGIFDGEGANQPDFLTPYLTQALACIGISSVQFVSLQATASADAETLASALAEQAASIEYPAVRALVE
jgi:FMN-dependent NADH-azoreductase